MAGESPNSIGVRADGAFMLAEVARWRQSESGEFIQGVFFPSTSPSPISRQILNLAASGVRASVAAAGELRPVTAIAIYVDRAGMIQELVAKHWRGRAVQDVTPREQLFVDAVLAPVEKLVKVVILPPYILSGQEFRSKVKANIVQCLGREGKKISLEDDEAEFLAENGNFDKAFEGQLFSPGCSIIFSISPAGVQIFFSSSNETTPIQPPEVIRSRKIGEALLMTIIGKDGVSPQARASFAEGIRSMLLM